MFKALSDTTKYILIAGIILAIGIVIFIIWYSARQAGKRAGSTILNVSDPGGSDITSASEAEIRQVAGEVFSDMDGANIMGHNQNAWQRFLSLSDRDIIRVYNYFNSKYQKESGETLKQWVENENSTFDRVWSTTKETVLQRMNKLNLI